jgi:DnaK suppressor protein
MMMTDYSELEQRLTAQLDDLTRRAEAIERDLRQPLDADWEEQALDLADDEALEGVDEVLRTEIRQTRLALARIGQGTYGSCALCGEEIGLPRLNALPAATHCIACA